MNKFFAMMVALVATVFASSAFAWNPPPSPAPQSWISDPGHVLSDAAHARLDAKLKVINQSSANEIAALVLPTLDGENVTDVGDYTFKAWGVGKKDLDNGVLVVLGMKEHKSHITTGKGVEGDLPDLKCSDVLKNMRPYLQGVNNGGRPDVEGALGYAFDQSSTLIANHKAEAAAAAAKAAANPQPSASTSRGSCQVSAPGAGSGMTWLLVLLGGGLVVWLMMRRSSARSRERVSQIESETQALLDAQRARADRLNAEQESHRRAEQVRLQRETALPVPAHVEPPVLPVFPPAPIAPTFPVVPVVAAVAAATVINEAAEAEERRQHEAAARKRRLQQEEDDNRRRREQAEADDRRRREESSSSSYSSSSSSWDSGSSSSGGGWDSGGSGGFGGGDSGGGGASGDW